MVPSRPIASTQLKLGLRVPQWLSIEKGTQDLPGTQEPGWPEEEGKKGRKEAAAKPGSQPGA